MSSNNPASTGKLGPSSHSKLPKGPKRMGTMEGPKPQVGKKIPAGPGMWEKKSPPRTKLNEISHGR